MAGQLAEQVCTDSGFPFEVRHQSCMLWACIVFFWAVVLGGCVNNEVGGHALRTGNWAYGGSIALSVQYDRKCMFPSEKLLSHPRTCDMWF